MTNSSGLIHIPGLFLYSAKFFVSLKRRIIMELSDSGTWAVIIAAIAVILSQLPPIRDLLRGTEISISITDQLNLWHFLGNIQVYSLIDIDNKGSRRVSITKIECLLQDDYEKVWTLPAQVYISREPPSQPGGGRPEYLLGWISLKPQESWSETVRFYQHWTETEEEETSEIISIIREDITSQMPSDTLLEAQPSNVSKAKHFFDKKFDLHKGNYKLIVIAYSDEKLLSLSGFMFTLYESQIEALKYQTEEYKFGGGVYYPITGQQSYAWVRLKPILDKNEVKKLYERI